MRFSQDFIEKVRDANNLIEIISGFTQLKPNGDRHSGLCPFPGHNEKTPSFGVSESKQVYHCFGCKKSGNIFTFLKEMNGFSFPESVEYLAQRASIEIPKESLGSRQSNNSEKEKRELMWRLNDFASKYFHKNLLSTTADSAVRKYCAQRGIGREIIETFQVGLAENSWEGLTQFLKKNRAPLKEAEQLGLIKTRDNKSGQFDIFRHRLMFPIFSHTGRAVGFGGRVLGDENPKYLNSPESLVFNKRRTFYGLNETAKYIREEDSAIVVEGYMDLIALYSQGIKNVVATLGTALTADHARLIGRYTKNIVLLLDGDQAGQSAAERSLPVLLQQGLFVKNCCLPDKMDPDDFLKLKGADALKEKLKLSPDLLITILDKSLEGYRGESSQKVKVLDVMKNLFGSISDSNLRELYINEVADRINESAQWVEKALKREAEKAVKLQRPIQGPSPKNEQKLTPEAPESVLEEGEVINLRGMPKAELYLLNLVLMKKEYFSRVKESGCIDQLQHLGAQKIFRQVELSYGQIPSEFDKLTASLVSRVEPSSALTLHMEGQFAEMAKESAEKLLEDCLKKIQEAHFRREQKRIAQKLRAQAPDEQKENLERFMNIHKSRQALHKDFEPKN